MYFAILSFQQGTTTDCTHVSADSTVSMPLVSSSSFFILHRRVSFLLAGWSVRLLPWPSGESSVRQRARVYVCLRFISSRESKTCGGVAVIERQPGRGPDPTLDLLSVSFSSFLFEPNSSAER